jgi:D-aspartate ligase
MPEPTNSNGNFPTDGVGAVVLGGDYQGLGIARSLGRHGVPVCVIDDEKSIARYSRYVGTSFVVPSLLDPRDAVRTLLEIGEARRLRGWVLYPTRDEQVAALSQHSEELSQIFRVPTPGWDTIKWLWDKRNTYGMAEKLGIPAPRTWYPRGVDDLEQVSGHFPVAIKPAIKEHFIYATKQKAWRADDSVQLRKLFERALEHLPIEEIMIQDVIPGDGSRQYSYCSFFKQAESIAHLTACRRRQHPLEFGRSSTYVETIELPLLEEYSQRFLRAIDYYGLVEVEFKHDPRDGKYRILDVNGRTWGYHSIGCSAGTDFAYLLFADQIGNAVEPCVGKAGVRWIRLLTDLPTGLVGILSGQIDGGRYLRSLYGCDEEAVFSLEDPLPGLMEIALIPYLSSTRGF